MFINNYQLGQIHPASVTVPYAEATYRINAHNPDLSAKLIKIIE